jgi:hypothetical protein
MYPDHMERLARDRQAELRQRAVPRRDPSDRARPHRPGRPALVRGMGALLVRWGQRLAGPEALAPPPRLDLAHGRGPHR